MFLIVFLANTQRLTVGYQNATVSFVGVMNGLSYSVE